MASPLLQPQDHVIELGKLGLDCLIMSEEPVDLGRACHCVAATLATLAANEACAGYIMGAPGGSVVRSVLALVEVCALWFVGGSRGRSAYQQARCRPLQGRLIALRHCTPYLTGVEPRGGGARALLVHTFGVQPRS